MDGRTLWILFLILTPVFIEAWRTPRARKEPERRKSIHFHSKRHMQPDEEIRRREVPGRPKEMRKKPSGNLAPLEEEDIDNDEVISVAVGPPPLRGLHRANTKQSKQVPQHTPSTKKNNIEVGQSGATELVKNVLTELGREFLTYQVKEEFIFGQYVGNSMKNLTADSKVRMQHEILELISKYQKLSRGESVTEDAPPRLTNSPSKNNTNNEAEESWPDFTNLAKSVVD